jgi:hypothetical protein
MNRHERRKAKAKTGWVPLEQYVLTRTKAEIDAMVRDLAAHFPNKSEDEHRRSILNGMGELDDYWRNDQYAVHVIRWRGQGPNGCDIVQLSIKRHDRLPTRDWRDFQRIKNQLVGPECEAVELYPAESRLVDTATQYHLWCVKDPKYRWPIGYDEGRVITDKSLGMSVQREREEVDKAHDAK